MTWPYTCCSTCAVQEKTANRIREMREAAGMTQAELAYAAGLTVGAISQIERGENEPKLGSAAAIARVLGTSVDALFLAGEPTSAVGHSQMDGGLPTVLAPPGPPVASEPSGDGSPAGAAAGDRAGERS